MAEETESTTNGVKAQEFFITKSTVEEAPEVEWEELPAPVMFRDPPIKQPNDLSKPSDYLVLCLLFQPQENRSPLV